MVDLGRREVLAGLGGLGSLAASSVIGPDGLFASPASLEESVSAGTWPMYGHNPRRSGYAPDAEGPTTDLTLEWQADIDWKQYFSERRFPKMGPVVDDSQVYVLEGDGVVALDRTDGSRRWRFDPLPVDFPPLFSIDEDYYGSDDLDWSSAGWLACRDGQVFATRLTTEDEKTYEVLYAIDASTGSMNWAVPGARGWTLVGDKIIFNASLDIDTNQANYNYDGIVDASSGRFVEGLDIHGFEGAVFTAEGLEQFEKNVDKNYGYIQDKQPDSTGDDMTFVCDAFYQKTIASTGLTLARHDHYHDPDVVVLDLKSGTHRQFCMELPKKTRSMTDDERWYLVTSESVIAHEIIGVDARDKADTEVWETSLPPKVEKPALTDTGLYVPTEEGLFILDPDTGEILNQIERSGPPGNEMWQAPVVVDGTLYCHLRDGKLRAYS